jgi:hypothetical protein
MSHCPPDAASREDTNAVHACADCHKYASVCIVVGK